MADDTIRTGTTKTTTLETENRAREEANDDPITGEPGAHPVGTGVGAATGGTVGAVVGGAVGGPVGAMIGAAVGGLAGGLAGKGVAESVNPTEEDTFWREHYNTRPYAQGRSYEELQPAYRYGWEARTRHTDINWNDVEGDLNRDWTSRNSTLGWGEARHAARDAWNRVEGRSRYENQEDPYWRQTWQSRPYAAGGSYDYDVDLQPAYRYGYESGYSHTGRRWEDAENDLERGWEKAKGKSRLTWERAKDAVKDAWERATGPDLDEGYSGSR